MILFCNAFVLCISVLYSAGSKCTKNMFNCSLVVLCCAFIMFRTLYSSSYSSRFISLVFVESCSYLMTIP